MSEAIEDRARFDIIRYANVWEDADILKRALKAAPGKRILSIASGGDNVFSLLAAGAEVIAADLSPAQLAITELKAKAIEALSREELLAFLGIRPSRERLGTYRGLAPALSEESRSYWDRNTAVIEDGLVHAGKFEKYFQLFRKRILPFVHRRSTIEALMAVKPIEEQAKFYHERWNTWRWRAMYKIFFSRFIMGRFGRDPEFFRYVEGNVSERLLKRSQFTLTTLPLHRNPYVDYIVSGNFDHALPPYLEEESLSALRQNLKKMTLYLGPVQQAAKAHGPFDGFNLSDIFEYLDEKLCEEVYAGLLAAATPGARLAYWNMLVPRSCPGKLRAQVSPLDDLSQELFREDRACFYSRFVVEERRG